MWQSEVQLNEVFLWEDFLIVQMKEGFESWSSSSLRMGIHGRWQLSWGDISNWSNYLFASIIFLGKAGQG